LKFLKLKKWGGGGSDMGVDNEGYIKEKLNKKQKGKDVIGVW